MTKNPIQKTAVERLADQDGGTGTPLFRLAALEHRQQQWLGDVVLTGSSQQLGTSVVLFAIAVSLGLFLVFGEYTRKEEVQGRVTLNDGPADVFAPVMGTVVRQLVHEGEQVKAGQPLLVLSTDRTIASGSSRESMGVSLRARRSSLEDARQQQKTVLDEETRALKERIADLETAIRHLDAEIVGTGNRYDLSLTNNRRFEQLRSEDIVSQSELEQHQQESLTQQTALEDLRKQRSSSQSELAQLRADLANAPLKEQNTLAEIQRQIFELDSEITDNESNRQITIPARVDGEVTSLLSRVGETVNPTTPLLSLLPRDGHFVVHLFAPSKAIGFVKVGNPVSLQYDAFPYEKFGQYKGHVSSISRTALSPGQLQSLIPGQTESLYRVAVDLDAQTVNAYGKQVPLQDGMSVQGDVQIDTRKLYEWVLEPLYALTRRS